MVHTHYPGMVNSPSTTLSGAIAIDATTIPVTELSAFATAPNLAVIGTGIDAETIKYEGKSGSSGTGNLTTVTREFQGTAKAWDAGTAIARNFTEYDLHALQEDIVLSAPLSSPAFTGTPTAPTAAKAVDNTQIATTEFVHQFTRRITLAAESAITPFSNAAVLGQGTGAADLSNGFSLPYGIYTVANRGTERLQWKTHLDPMWDNGDVSASVEWTANSTSGNDVTWLLYAIRVPDNSSLNVTPVLVATITDTHNAVAWYKNLSSVTSFAITGTGNTILWEAKRSSAGTDTLVADALLEAFLVDYGV